MMIMGVVYDRDDKSSVQGPMSHVAMAESCREHPVGGSSE